MKINPLLFLVASVLLAVSCSKDDGADPAGTIAVNMLNEGNGKTLLGNSDVYIDNANNFFGPSCFITTLGKKNGLDSAPVLNGLGAKVAVEPGYAYQVFRNAAVRQFPSGKLALNISADYYNVNVVSPIERGDEVVGANVKYALMDIPDYDLPEYNKNIGAFDRYDYLDGYEIVIDLPTSDFEYEPVLAGSNYYTLDYEKVDDKLVVRLIDYKYSDVFGFYIRVKDSFTYVYGEVY